MLPRKPLLNLIPRSRFFPATAAASKMSTAVSASATPVEDVIREKVCMHTLHRCGHWPIEYDGSKYIFNSYDSSWLLYPSKLTTAFSPSTLLIRNDSHLHAHHQAMRGSVSKETHFQCVFPGPFLIFLPPVHLPTYSSVRRQCVPNWTPFLHRYSVTITTSAFQSKPQPARHRMVYALLKEEISREGGIHALQLRTRTPDEEQKQMQTQTQIQTQNGQELSQ